MRQGQFILTIIVLCGPIAGIARADDAAVPFPAPKHQLRIDRSVMIEMRDGTKLSTDLYFPQGAGDKLPVILLRTPYNKTRPNGRIETLARGFASQGFVFAAQDVRGRFESEGQYLPQLGDADDGFDTVEWLAHQSWSNGRVGTYGCSYMGDVQILMAQRRPPSLRAMVPQAAGSSIGSAGGQYKYFGARRSGVIEFAQNVAWFYDNGKYFYRPPPGLTREQFLELAPHFDPAPKARPASYPELWWHLPVNELMKHAGAVPNDFTEMATRGVMDPWWHQFYYMTDDYRSDVPALHVNSWYDFGIREVLFEYEIMRKRSLSSRARDNQYLIISPATHCRSEYLTANEPVGGRNVGDARRDYWSTYLDWFEHWLRKDSSTALSMPRVQYFLMGSNEWRTAADWPIPGTRMTRYYLRSNGRANSRFGDGRLTTDTPTDEPPDEFTYDPATPVPTLGGPVCCTGADLQAGSFDQSHIETRNDVLVYTTPPLTHGMEVTGTIDAVLYVSSSARDTDFTAKLVDVYPDGRAFNIQEGIIRARVREGLEREVLMQPVRVYEVRIEMGATGNFFGAGHRIRLEVSSSNFPRFDRNLNTGGRNYDETAWKVAQNAVHHSEDHASYLLLPIVGR